MRKIRKRKWMVNPGRWMMGLAVFLLIRIAAGRDLGAADRSFGTVVRQSLTEEFTRTLYEQFLPTASMPKSRSGMDWLLARSMGNIMPLYGLAGRGSGGVPEAKQHTTMLRYTDLTREIAGEEHTDIPGQGGEEDFLALLQQENEAAAGAAGIEGNAGSQIAPDPAAGAATEPAAELDTHFEAHEKRITIDPEELQDYETLIKTFYTIDANTMAGSDQLNVDRLLGKDMRIDKNTEGPQILIYHTHSQEAFADSVPGDDATGILGVGERLAEILRDEYGYRVMHHEGRYDVQSRDNAYGLALPDLERILRENPSIQVVIDLHRDQMPEDTRLVMNLDGRPTARFMFFNGLSRTRKTGDIAYLKNENIADNLAFSFQMQLRAEEYYPGLTRKIYLKGYRYNMHLCPKTLLVELGAQNNTVEEAMNACDPLAHILDMVLSGAE